MSSLAGALSSTQQASKVLKQSNSSEKYYQMVYDDERGRCIVESRRRSKVLRDAATVDIGRSRSWPILDVINAVSSEPLSTDDRCRPSERGHSGHRKSLAPPRDSILDKSSTGRSETVIIFPAPSRSGRAKKGSTIATSFGQTELKTPPKPRMGRLPTPELSELDERPFCECDKTALMLCCISCKSAASPCVRWE